MARVKAPDCLKRFAKEQLAESDIYVFGVGSGKTTVNLYRALAAKKIPFRKLWTFDSFQGLPEERPGLPRHRLWTPGNYRFSEEQTRATLAKTIPEGRYEVLVGWFEEVLTPGLVLKKGMRRASLIDIDVDLYLSTKTILRWVQESGILIDALIYYDDWGGVPEYTGGESLAHKEIVREFGWQATRVYNGIQPIFRVRGS